jgi:hypothetical protein
VDEGLQISFKIKCLSSLLEPWITNDVWEFGISKKIQLLIQMLIGMQRDSSIHPI